MKNSFKIHCSPIETALNWGVILYTLTVIVFEQMYPGKTQKGEKKQQGVKYCKHTGELSYACNKDGHMRHEKRSVDCEDKVNLQTSCI